MIKRYGKGNYSEISEFTLDQIQQNFECCGIYDKIDWEQNEFVQALLNFNIKRLK